MVIVEFVLGVAVGDVTASVMRQADGILVDNLDEMLGQNPLHQHSGGVERLGADVARRRWR